MRYQMAKQTCLMCGTDVEFVPFTDPICEECRKPRRMFEVSADWMKACGFGEEAKVYPVISEYERGGYLFAELDRGNYATLGTTWTVNTNWRGRFVD
jgi:ribosomal protein L37E